MTLDDHATFAAAKSDPLAFIRGFDRAVIDEVQRAPESLLAIKRSIDEDRRPGRFLLTGAANLSTIATVRDSLAGRIVDLLKVQEAMMDAEHSMVQFGRTSIQYVIERGRRHKTVAIAVDPERGVRIRAPRNTSIAKLDDIVRRRAKWIVDRRRRHEDLPPQPTPREFVTTHAARYRVQSWNHPSRFGSPPIRAIAPQVATADAGLAWLMDTLEKTTTAQP